MSKNKDENLDIFDESEDLSDFDDSGSMEDNDEGYSDEVELQEADKNDGGLVKEDSVLKTEKKKKKTGLWIGLGVVAVIVLFAVVKLIGAKNGKKDFYAEINNIFSNEVGTFHYEMEVQTAEKGTNAEEIPDSTTEAISTEEGASESTLEETTEVQEKTLTAKTDENWGNKDNIETDDWEYPSYKITISGTTKSVEPLATHFDIAIATPYFNSNFTDVTVLDGKYYINIEQMRYWLTNSKDSYLIEVGNKLPDGSKYLVLSEEEFAYYSRLAEASEKDSSKATGLVTLYRRFLVKEKIFMNAASKGLGKTGITQDGDITNLDLSGENANKVFNNIKNLVVNCGDAYNSYLSSAKSLYSEGQASQAKNEKDNFIEAMAMLSKYVSIEENGAVTVKGAIRKYSDAKQNAVSEAIINTQTSLNGKDYNINFVLSRSNAVSDVVLPDGSQVTNDKLESPTLIEDVCYDVVDYFNPFDIDLDKKLALSNDVLKEQILDKFIEQVNQSGYADKYITRHNVQEFIDTYVAYEGTDENGVNAMKLVGDYMEMLNSITGGVVKTEVVQQEEEVEQYPIIVSNVDGLQITASFDKNSSDSKLYKVNMKLENYSVDKKEIDLTNFSLQTLQSSKYPSNNYTLLKDYDNNIDEDSITTSVELEANQFTETTLQFIISDDSGYMDLWYGDTKLGVLQAY